MSEWIALLTREEEIPFFDPTFLKRVFSF